MWQDSTQSSRDPAREADAAIYRISHDLGAAIRSLTHLSSWVAEDITEAGYDLPHAARDNIAFLHDRANRLQVMLEDLLTYSVVGKGGAPYVGNLQSLVAEIVSEVPNAARFEIILSDDGIPQIDAADLRHLLTALLSNAMKHHDAEAGKIWVTCEDTAVYVIDDGPGIPRDLWNKACEIMTTLKPRDVTEGSGMGLAICSKIATHYGGRLHMTKPNSGRGCCITLQLDKG